MSESYTPVVTTVSTPVVVPAGPIRIIVPVVGLETNAGVVVVVVVVLFTRHFYLVCVSKYYSNWLKQVCSPIPHK